MVFGLLADKTLTGQSRTRGTSLVALLRRYLKVRGYRHGPLFRAEKTTREARCGMPPSRNSGPNTARKPRSRPRFISCATSTPPSWSTPGCPWKPSDAASDTPTPKQCFATPTNTTPPPTRRSAAGADERSPGARAVDLPRIRTVSLKRILGPKHGFETPATAYRTLKGDRSDARTAQRPGQDLRLWTLEPGRSDRREGVHLRLSTARA